MFGYVYLTGYITADFSLTLACGAATVGIGNVGAENPTNGGQNEFATRHVGPRRRERRANNTTPSGLKAEDAAALEAAEDKRRGGPANLGEPPGSGTPAPIKLPGEKNWWV